MKAYEDAMRQEAEAAEAEKQAMAQRLVSLENDIRLLEESLSTIDRNMPDVTEQSTSSSSHMTHP